MAQNNEYEQMCDRTKMVLRLRELFHGRFTNEEVEKLLQLNNFEQGRTVFYILSSDTQELCRVLTEDADTVAKLNYIRNNDKLVEEAKQNYIGLAIRQFTCHPCNNMWWRVTPRRKPVSRCKTCQVRYDPVPKDVEFGSAVFVCKSCNNEFRGFGQKSTTRSVCYNCNNLCYPTKIEPPKSNHGRRNWKSQHSCDAPDCCGHLSDCDKDINVYGPSGLQKRCVHPRRQRNRSIYYPCFEHNSTGSTVETFLTQRFETDSVSEFSVSLETIMEDADITSNMSTLTLSDSNAGNEPDEPVGFPSAKPKSSAMSSLTSYPTSAEHVAKTDKTQMVNIKQVNKTVQPEEKTKQKKKSEKKD
ncbi:Hypothetical predicted protein [Octopus vulgaris]|uniref:Uncharacterized protein n=2 Tax=Octopus TaxID=6643 RepID=A0AA36AH87_OCTVU|nr:shiftless antiviral inhibitor of ribosomal frameshifting protein homolog [Octopus sinensis]CAI9715453.1 Hypothetical predicted protein [Octopus vulgaris]